MRCGFVAKLFAACLAALAMAVTPGAQELEFRGFAEQLAGAAFLLDGSMPVTYGSASSLDGALEFNHGAVSINISGRLAILYGSRAANARAALALDPDSRIGVLTQRDYDPETYNPAIPDSSWFMSLSLGEAVLALSLGNLSAEAGKMIVNWGVGTAFSPADFFSDIDYSGGSPTRRSSVIGRLSWFPGPVSRVDIAAEPFAFEGATYAVRGYSIVGERASFALEVGYKRGISPSPSLALAALELSLDIPIVSTYGEVAFAYDPEGSGMPSFKAMAGAQSRIGNLSLAAEYCYDDTSTSMHRAFLRASLPLGDWVNLLVPAYIDFSLRSFTTGMTITIPDLGGLASALSASVSRSAQGVWSTGVDLSARASF